MRLLSLILFSIISLCSYAQVSRNFDKKKRPLYEVGGALVTFNIPNYPGAASNTPRFIPSPFFIYRGDFFRSDEDGTRARLLNSDIFELGMSGGFNFPIDSNSNAARKGMPDTDTLFGIGPNVLIRFFEGDPLNKLTLGVGFRLNLAIGSQFLIKEQGWLIEPNLRYFRRFSKGSPFSLFAGLSMSYGDKKYNRFFYQVDEEYKTSKRDRYDAKEGVVDIGTSLAFSYNINSKASLFLGAFQSNLTTAANKNSPLVEEQINTGIVAGFVWLFYESDELVE
jgi:outer membrane scaffolding protein for murein synthesis (MipA/OmpV family)